MPVVRPDINGKLVTRHVIADPMVESAVRLPAPMATPRLMGEKEYARRIADHLVTAKDDADRPWRTSVAEQKRILAEAYEQSISLHELQRLHDRMLGFNKVEHAIFEHQVLSMFDEFVRGEVNSVGRDQIFHGILDSADMFAMFYPVAFGSDHIFKPSRGALWMADRMDVDPRSSSEAEREIYRFLLFKEIIGDESYLDVLEVHRKSQWFAENESLIFSHAKEIMTRKGAGLDWLTELTNPESAPSLSEGTL